MTKIRVHEYARKVNKSSKEVIEELNKLNINVTNHMSMLEGDAVSKLDTVFNSNTNAGNAKTTQKVATNVAPKPKNTSKEQQMTKQKNLQITQITKINNLLKDRIRK